MQIHLLDVGPTKYGDCILIINNGRNILIDGAHPGDRPRILPQLKKLLNQEPPFSINLLVVTHCHQDHIGDLPTLISRGDLKVEFALIADEKLGWGISADGSSPIDGLALTDTQKSIVAAIHEENYSDLPDLELEQFLDDALTLESKYKGMISDLQTQGTAIIRYGRDSDDQIKQLEHSFIDFGLKILGPTLEQLLICAEEIANTLSSAGDQLSTISEFDAIPSNRIQLYRQIVNGLSLDVVVDNGRDGSALNNQSIVLKVEANGKKALLAGDMQLVDPQSKSLDVLMVELRKRILESGPYDFIKLTHHSSDNGLDNKLLAEWASTKLFAHSGGINDPKHPDPTVLLLLDRHHDQLKYARTDRNGLISVGLQDPIDMVPSRGNLNDFTPNPKQSRDSIGRSSTLLPKNETIQPEVSSSITSTKEQFDQEQRDIVEVITRIPNSSTKVTVTIEIDPVKKKVNSDEIVSHEMLSINKPSANLLVGNGRSLPNLVVVTCKSKLARNIGQTEAEIALQSIANTKNLQLIDLPSKIDTAEKVANELRNHLQDLELAGVVVLGGYDVIPSYRLDVLDANLRHTLEFNNQLNDQDEFFVWSDDIFGDRDGDFIAELPVSRIPDGHLAAVVFNALQTPSFIPDTRFGIRNIRRPFADKIFSLLPGHSGNLEVSETFGPAHILPNSARGAVYYMLHGSNKDGTRFAGEVLSGGGFEALTIENVPVSAPGTIVLTGCCWGALTVSPQALFANPDTIVQPRGPESSIAIAYLLAGSQAFVGCTGSHYSPFSPPYNNAGKPMHEAFWINVANGIPPAKALYLAKQEYIRGMPHGLTTSIGEAVELKTLHQFTCLGLGW